MCPTAHTMHMLRRRVMEPCHTTHTSDMETRLKCAPTCTCRELHPARARGRVTPLLPDPSPPPPGPSQWVPTCTPPWVRGIPHFQRQASFSIHWFVPFKMSFQAQAQTRVCSGSRTPPSRERAHEASSLAASSLPTSPSKPGLLVPTSGFGRINR